MTDEQRERLSLFLHDESERLGITPAALFQRLEKDPSAMASAIAYEGQTTTEPE